MSKMRRLESDFGGGSKGRVRVVFIDMEARDETIQESIRALTAAITQSGGRRAPLGLPPAARPTAPEDSGNDQQHAPEAPEDSGNLVPEPRDPSTTKPRRKATVPEIVEVKLSLGKNTLEQFLARYNPDSQLEKSLVCAAWWRDELGVPEIGPDHLYTCFKMMKWTDGPNDYRVPFADLERKKEQLTKVSRGLWKLNHIGEKELARLEAARMSKP